MTHASPISYSRILLAVVFGIALLLMPFVSVRAEGDTGAIAGQKESVLLETGTAVANEPPLSEDSSSVLADEPAPAVVETGAAVAVSDTENSVNMNEIESAGGDLTVAATNTADAINETTAEATTGDNVAVGGDGGAIIATGDAYASANSLNVINTNIVDANGLLLFKDFFASLGIDLRDFDLSFFSSQNVGGGGLSVTNSNTATSTNSVTVIASTGSNTATTTDGTAVITTGNAYASGNAVNLVNTNIIRSNYLLVGINNFGDLGGDITLPGADFFKALFARNSGLSQATAANVANTAVVANDTSALSDTGGNDSISNSATVNSGTAIAGATTVNQVNTNAIGGANIFFLFRIWGGWSGAVHGLPEGMQWRETPYGIELVNDDGNAGGGSLTSACATCSSALSVTNDNTAHVTNNVSVFALTGDNYATSKSGAATIQTGDAYASANTVNVVNTNLIGTNWILAIFNIFGNFSGNIAFGHPDLWLGAAAEVSNRTVPGSLVTYHFTVSNRGDADATNVRLSTDFARKYLAFDTGRDTERGIDFDLGTIRKGDTKEFVYTATAGTVSRGAVVPVPLSATVTSTETDNNNIDNTDALSIVIVNPRKFWGNTSPDPDLSIVKTANTSTTATPASVDYSVTIQNNGGPAYHVVATDTLTGPDGKIVKTQEWNLETIVSDEELLITYTAQFGRALPPGVYTNTIVLTGTNTELYSDYTPRFKTEASHTFLVTPRPPPQVIEVLEPEVVLSAPLCEEYLTTYLRPGFSNNREEVTKLQQFLNDKGFGPLVVTGTYDAPSVTAVKAFQKEYNTEVLSPWGYMRPTGVVYFTTRKMINNMVCDGSKTFALSSEQQDEIDATKRRLATVLAPVVDTVDETIDATEEVPLLPPSIEVGGTPPLLVPQQALKSWSWLDFLSSLIQRARAAETVVQSTTNASASTGGQTVKSGETSTTGSASASIKTVVNANDAHGTVKVEIETEDNGQVYKETRVEEIPAGQGIFVNVSTSTGSAKASIISQHNETNLDFIKKTSSTTASTASTTVTKKRALSRVSNLFKKAFSFFWWW